MSSTVRGLLTFFISNISYISSLAFDLSRMIENNVQLVPFMIICMQESILFLHFIPYKASTHFVGHWLTVKNQI